MTANQKRNINLDVIRCLAIFCVVAVHFFLNSGFYETPIAGKRMFIMMFMRTCFMVCIPLFLMLSGFLQNKKTLSKGYYFGFVRIYATYLMASILCILFKHYYLDIPYTVKSAIKGILGFSGDDYSWYINMFFGLFLLIPFLNVLYHHLDGKKQKQALIFSLLILTTLPAMFNTNYVVFPNWWLQIYPLLYYFIGAYLQEHEIKIKGWVNFVLIVLVVLLNTAWNMKTYAGVNYKWDAINDWFGPGNLLTSVLVFIWIKNRDFGWMPKLAARGFALVSKLSLGMYLVSYIFDQLLYPLLNTAIFPMQQRFGYFFLIVPLVFLGSFLLSYILDRIYYAISWICSRYKKKI